MVYAVNILPLTSSEAGASPAGSTLKSRNELRLFSFIDNLCRSILKIERASPSQTWRAEFWVNKNRHEAVMVLLDKKSFPDWWHPVL